MANTSYIKSWLLAARPRTLTASISPVAVGCALAHYKGEFSVLLMILCLLVALFAQVASNFANDYFDYRKGADGASRIGPERAVASGWLTPNAMLMGTIAMLVLTFIAGFAIIAMTSWWLILVGLAIGVFVLAYSAGPFPLAYNGLGDVCVLLFYGVVPVCATYYVLTGELSLLAFLLSLSMGLLSTNILVINNYRDVAEDSSNNKRTTIVIFGRRFGLAFYLINGLAAIDLAVIALFPLLHRLWAMLLFMLFLGLFLYTWQEMRVSEGRALNRVLGHTARNVFVFAIMIVVVLL